MAKPNRLDADGKEDVLRALAQALAPYLRQSLASADSGEQTTTIRTTVRSGAADTCRWCARAYFAGGKWVSACWSRDAT